MKSIIRASYKNLKNRLGRVSYLIDFYDNGEVDPLVIIREYKTYQAFLEAEEKELYTGKLSKEELTILEYLSKTVLLGARPYELEILKRFMKQEVIHIENMKSKNADETSCKRWFTSLFTKLYKSYIEEESEKKYENSKSCCCYCKSSE